MKFLGLVFLIFLLQINLDFKAIFPETENKLFENWDTGCDKLLILMKERIKDTEGKRLLLKLTNEDHSPGIVNETKILNLVLNVSFLINYYIKFFRSSLFHCYRFIALFATTIYKKSSATI